jgi:hypothetical protein
VRGRYLSQNDPADTDIVYVLDVRGERVAVVAFPIGPEAPLTDIVESIAFLRP